MNDVNIEPIWYYNTTWDDINIKINVKYIIK